MDWSVSGQWPMVGYCEISGAHKMRKEYHFLKTDLASRS